MFKRAIDNEWPVCDEMRDKVCSMAESELDAEDPKIRILAAQVLLSADRINVSREQSDRPGVTVNVGIQVESRAETILAELQAKGILELPDTTKTGVSQDASNPQPGDK